MDKLKIEYLTTDELIPYANNPRNNDEAVDYVANSIKEFGFKVPCVIDNEKNVVCGHTRLKAAKKLGIKEVPCIIADDLTEEQIDAFRLADNKTSEIATWDFEKLEIELESISGIDMSEFGFDIDLDEEEPTEIVEDEVPEEVETKAKLGDLWILGSHRLVCGDSTDPTVIDRLMDGAKADMVFTDPPYGVDYKGINNDSRDGLSDLLNGAFATAMANTKQGGAVYCFHSDKCADIFQDCFRKFCHFSSMIIWKKSALVLSQTDYQSIHEPCLYGWFNNGTHNFYGDRKQTSVWEFDRENIDGHTTPKPIGFIAKALQNSSREGEIVLDVFGGSGSTLIACEQLNRKCYMAELDPKYVSIILQRYINFKGSDEDVFLLKDGKKIPYSKVKSQG